MRIYDIRDSDGRVVAFEVPNFFLGRRGACRVVRAIAAARILRTPRRFRLFDDEEFCEFELEGEQFVLYEPYGDNTRYWIGPKQPRWVPQLSIVREAFERAGLWGWFRRAAG